MIDQDQNDIDINKALTTIGYVREDVPDGWTWRNIGSLGRYDDQYTGLTLRREDSHTARIRCMPDQGKLNLNDVIHGAFLLALADHALFVAPIALGYTDALGGSTIEISTHYYAPATAEHPVDIVAGAMRETGRMIFVCGTFQQNGQPVAGFSGILRKLTQRPGQT